MTRTGRLRLSRFRSMTPKFAVSSFIMNGLIRRWNILTILTTIGIATPHRRESVSK